jgi:hypothetical protein
MEAELRAANERILALEAEINVCMSEAERVRQQARNLYNVQHQLRNEIFNLQRRVDNYALTNTQLARQVYPPSPFTSYPAHEVLTIDFG